MWGWLTQGGWGVPILRDTQKLPGHWHVQFAQVVLMEPDYLHPQLFCEIHDSMHKQTEKRLIRTVSFDIIQQFCMPRLKKYSDCNLSLKTISFCHCWKQNAVLLGKKKKNRSLVLLKCTKIAFPIMYLFYHLHFLLSFSPNRHSRMTTYTLCCQGQP